MAKATQHGDRSACIRACQECHGICLETSMTRRLLEAAHMRLLADCTALCATAADFMLRGSEFDTKICELCAKVCEACAASCREVGGMEECVRACEDCAEHCRRIASATTRARPEARLLSRQSS